jgi:hypothetical protein
MENEDPTLWLNWDVIAERWLDLIRPAWYAALSGRRKQARPLLLKDVRQDLLHGKQFGTVGCTAGVRSCADAAAA